MKFRIHRGTKEIGGSCVEVWTEKYRIVLDMGMPLVGGDKTTHFDASSVNTQNVEDLIEQKILPAINGLYNPPGNTALILSHAHQDHYGLVQFIHDDCPVYLGEATHKLIDITNIFTKNSCFISNHRYYSSGKSFRFGDIEITPYLMDHAAFDAYAFLVKADGKSLFYSGDFRMHGRKTKVFDWFKYNVESDVDYLLLEGTSIGRVQQTYPSETDLEEEFLKQFKDNQGITLIYVSGQNIDRLVSIYRACKRAKKLFVVDFYVATVLKEMAKFAALPFPSPQFPEIRVFFPYKLSQLVANQGMQHILYQFKQYKITKAEIDEHFTDIVMTIRPSMKPDLTRLTTLAGGTFIYSMWSGYRKQESTRDFIDFLVNDGMRDISIHTSGHADLDGLRQMVAALKPKQLVPIHTFAKNEYPDIFSDSAVRLVDDGQVLTV